MGLVQLADGEDTRPVEHYISGLAGSDSERASNIEKAVARGLRAVEWEAPHDRRLSLACYGPSLRTTYPALARGGELWTVSGANAYLFKRGITPTGHVEIDPRAHKAKVLEGACPTTTYYLASRCAPEMFDAVPGTTRLFHMNVREERETLQRQRVTPQQLISTGLVCGLAAIQLAFAKGYRDFDVYGMDCSYYSGADLAVCDPAYPVPIEVYDSFQSHASDHPTSYREAQCVEVDGQRFLTDPLMLAAVSDYFAVLGQCRGARVLLHGQGLLQTVESISRVR